MLFFAHRPTRALRVLVQRLNPNLFDVGKFIIQFYGEKHLVGHLEFCNGTIVIVAKLPKNKWSMVMHGGCKKRRTRIFFKK